MYHFRNAERESLRAYQTESIPWAFYQPGSNICTTDIRCVDRFKQGTHHPLRSETGGKASYAPCDYCIKSHHSLYQNILLKKWVIDPLSPVKLVTG